MRVKRRPVCYIIAGPNGAGKTTFAREFLPRYADCVNFVNVDLIAAGLSPFNPDRAAREAGHLVLGKIRGLAAGRKDFAFETTPSGRTYLPLLRKIREEGYRVRRFYLWLPSVKMSLERVADRVKRGGHDVPAADVRRRFPRTLENLFNLYHPLLDSLYFFDASEVEPALIFEQVEGHVQVRQPGKYEIIMKGISR